MLALGELAQQLLLAVKKQQSTVALQQQLAELSWLTLRQELSDDARKKAFWINVYNAFYQVLRMEKGLTPPEIYRQRVICLAGEAFSLDDVEHGILRKYQYKRPPEQFSDVFKPDLIKSLAVDKVDGRIHFALNCGAVSCPPIAFYDEDKIEAQLTLTTQSFLASESKVDAENETVSTTALLDWYAEDFGNNDGVRILLEDALGRELSGFLLRFQEYSWEESLGNFA